MSDVAFTDWCMIGHGTRKHVFRGQYQVSECLRGPAVVGVTDFAPPCRMCMKRMKQAENEHATGMLFGEKKPENKC